MHFYLLGPVRASVRGQTIDLGPPRQRTVLATLLATPGEPVRCQTVIDRVWGDAPPRAARDTLYSYVTRLRRALEGRDGHPGTAARLIRTAHGYLLDVPAESVDVFRARRVVAAARAAEARGDDRRAASLVAEALAMWHDEPAGGLVGDWAVGLRVSLDEERLALLSWRFTVELRLGRHVELVHDLSAAVARRPLDEGLVGQMMLALYRGGRRAEALEVYARMRRRVVSEIGDEPGAALQGLQRAILCGDPRIDLPGSPPPAPASWPGGAGLPTPVPLLGRQGELDRIRAVLESATDLPAVVAIDGMPGVGKSALATAAAHRLVTTYPDAQVQVDLQGSTPGPSPRSVASVFATLLRGCGHSDTALSEDEATLAARWRAWVAGRRVLVILDDASDVDQVRPLLSMAPGCAVLVTSRHRLVGLGVPAFSLSALAPAEAEALLRRHIGDDRAAHDAAAISEVAELCGGLPLALVAAGSRLRHRPAWTVRDLARRLSDETRRLAELATVDRRVIAGLELAYQRLGPAERQMFELLGVHPGTDIGITSAAALADRPPDECGRSLERLVDANLLTSAAVDRYRMHPLVRCFAVGLAAPESGLAPPEGGEVAGRLARHYTDRAVEAVAAVTGGASGRRQPASVFTTRAEALGWLEAERTNLLALVRRMVAQGDAVPACRMATCLVPFYELRGYHGDWIASHEAIVGMAGRLGAEARAASANNLGLAYVRVGRYLDAVDQFSAALAALAGRPAGADGAIRNNLGNALRRLGRRAEAAVHYRAYLESARQRANHRAEAVALANMAVLAGCSTSALWQSRTAFAWFATAGDERSAGAVRAVLGTLANRYGHFARALVHHERSLAMRRALADRVGEMSSLIGLGRMYLDAGQPHQALAYHLDALQLATTVGDDGSRCTILNGLGDTYRALSRSAEAVEHHRQALAIARISGQETERSYALRAIAESRAPTAVDHGSDAT